MLKIGIMGLRPRQTATFDSLIIEGAEIDVFPEGKTSVARAKAYAEAKDKVILIKSAVPSTIPGAIPVEKRIVLSGSISTVVKTIEALPGVKVSKKSDGLAQVVRKVLTLSKPKAEEPPAPVVSQKTAAQLEYERITALMESADHQPITIDTPMGYTTLYRRPTRTPTAIWPDADGRHNFRVLRNMRDEEVYRFVQPEYMSFEHWRSVVAKAIYNQNRVNASAIEAAFYSGYADLMLLPPSSMAIPEFVPMEVPTVEETPAGPALAYGEELVFDDVEIPDSPICTPVEEPSVEDTVATASAILNIEDVAFWEKAYLAFAHHQDAITAAASAGIAVAERRKVISI